MSFTRRLKLSLVILTILTILGYMCVLFGMAPSAKVFGNSFWGAGLGDHSKMREVLSLESGIKPTVVTDSWVKTEENTASLQTMLAFHQHPERSHMNSSVISGVVVLVSSMPQNTQLRNVIRSTWADAKTAQRLELTVVFTMGSPKEEISGLTDESSTYNDVLIGNFTDEVRASTLKLLLGLTWVAQKYPDAKFVLLVDDHTFVNTKRLLGYLKSLKGEELVRAWHGRRSSATIPVRDPKSVYYVSKELYPRKAFPEYCTSEAGFILTMDAVDLILEHSRHAPLVTLDDVFVSIIAEKLSFRLFDNHAFTLTKVSQDGCSLESVLTARMSLENATDLLVVWNHVKSGSCSRPDWFPGDGTNDRYFKQCLKTVITHGDICFERTGEKKDVFLLLLVSSLPSHFERRQAIRETWGKQRVFFGKQTVLLFTLATETTNATEIQKKVNEENERHGDIIQAEFRESFHNLTLKVVFGLKWVTENCPHTKYFYKGDDDMFVNMKNIITLLNKTSESNKRRLFVGNRMLRRRPVTIKKSKYYVPETQFNEAYYPPYCSGGGYVISGNLIPEMFEASRWIHVIPIDDAYQGMLAKKVGLRVTHNKRFLVFARKGKTTSPSKCSLEQCVVKHHKNLRSFVDLRTAWSIYTNDSIPCI
ncbi:uncharacterized protein [Asterias amurensis]|uniref:uncharacterized protein n=1 Tax=Asterias amurensis TaxID=7602 RepID=UPI003AB70272